MSYPVTIAKRIIFNAQPSFSGFIIRLAMAATILSVATMIITLSLVNGFQEAVSTKVYSFWGHGRVQKLSPFQVVESDETGFVANDSLLRSFDNIPDLQHRYPFAVKSVVLKAKGQFEGIMLKGVGNGFDTAGFKAFIKAGAGLSLRSDSRVNEIVISSHTAERMELAAGDTLQCFFIRNGQDIRSRPVIVKGIYKTGIEEYDKFFGLADLRLLQRLNLWQDNVAGGIALVFHNPEAVYTHRDRINAGLPMELECLGIGEIYPNIFDWLAIQNQTKRIIIITMLVVAIINLITCLLILVMERTRMVGILKALGMTDRNIGLIFWYYAGWIALVGVGCGLVLGVGLCWLQQATGFLKMDEATYYVATAPVSIDFLQIMLVVTGSLITCLLAIRLPLFYIQRVTPIRAIRFD